MNKSKMWEALNSPNLTASRGTERIGIKPCLTWDEWHHLIRVLLEYAQDAQDKAETLQTVGCMIENMEVESGQD